MESGAPTRLVEPLQLEAALESLKGFMNTVWFVIGAAIIGAVVTLITALQRGDRRSDLGTVSHQWIAEHRLQGQDLRR